MTELGRMIEHTPRIERSTPKRFPTLHRMYCPCGTASPFSVSRPAAELALKRHEWENHLDQREAVA